MRQAWHLCAAEAGPAPECASSTSKHKAGHRGLMASKAEHPAAKDIVSSQGKERRHTRPARHYTRQCAPLENHDTSSKRTLTLHAQRGAKPLATIHNASPSLGVCACGNRTWRTHTYQATAHSRGAGQHYVHTSTTTDGGVPLQCAHLRRQKPGEQIKFKKGIAPVPSPLARAGQAHAAST